MYFSSRGHTSMGGYDIFKSTWDSTSNKWNKPINLGYPVNTPDDDLYFVMSHTSTKAYFSSYRTEGFGEKDIYELTPIEMVVIDGLLVDGNKLPIKQSNINIRLQPTETASKNADSKNIDVNKDGTFSLPALSSNNYIVSVFDGKDMIHQDTLAVQLSPVVGQHMRYECVVPIKQKVDSTVVAKDTAGVHTDTIPPSNIKLSSTRTEHAEDKKAIYVYYFESNSATVSPSNKADLQKIVAVLNEHPTAKIVVKGHADASGSVAKNKILSSKRANSVKDYIVYKGISATRITVESFGSSKPFASNDTEEGRAKNRRTEVSVQ
jgi:outer membrane protein OmpA-like peptidoglycan-associated protein